MKPANPQPAVPQASAASMDNNASERFSGWRVLVVLWFIFMNFSLMVYGGSILNAYMANALQMPRDSFGGGVSLAYLLMGLAAPLTALLLNRVRARLTLFIGMLLFSISALILGTMVRDALGFTIAYGLIAGLGFSVGGLLPLQAVVANWFVRKRSLATAVLLSSGGFGGLLASYLFSHLIERVGLDWQNVWLLISAFSFVLAMLTLLLVRNNPEELGQKPDGIPRPVKVNTSYKPVRQKVHQTDVEWTFKDVMRSPSVWFIFVGSLGMAISFEFAAAYGVIHLMDIGFPNVVASVSVGILALFAIIGRLLTGYLGSRVELRLIMVAGSTLIGLGCLLVLSPQSSAMIQLYALLTGLGQGLVFVALFTVIPNYYGTKVVPSVFAVLMPFTSLAIAGVIFLGGIIRTNTGSYVAGFVLCVVIAFVAAAVSYLAKPPQKQ
jgi:sugar phosphate permease